MTETISKCSNENSSRSITETSIFPVHDPQQTKNEQHVREDIDRENMPNLSDVIGGNDETVNKEPIISDSRSQNIDVQMTSDETNSLIDDDGAETWKVSEITEGDANPSEVDESSRGETAHSVNDLGSHFVVNRFRAVTVKVPMQVMGQDVKAVIDTGAEVTVMSERLYHSIPDVSRPQLCQASRGLVVAEANKSMKTNGVADVEIQLGGQSYKWPVYVAPIGDDLLLGCDFIYAQDMTVNTRRGLEVNGKWIECEVDRKPESISRVTLRRSVTIPANCEFLVTGKSDSNEAVTTAYATVQPMVEDSRRLIIAHSLVNTPCNNIPVRIMNISKSPVRLKKGYFLGELCPVEQCIEMNSGETELIESNFTCEHSVPRSFVKSPVYDRIKDSVTSSESNKDTAEVRLVSPPVMNKSEDFGCNGKVGNKVEFPELPEYLKELFEDSCKNLKEKSQKKKLAELLLSYKSAFASSKTDIGCCSLIKHRIETGEAAPIRQPLRRTPQGFEGEEEKYLKEQLEAKVIVPSKSAWASPVCLVRKKDGSVRWCIDFRRVNDVCIKDAYPLPRMDMCIDCLASAKIFSTLDLQSGYWQIAMEEKDQCKTAFITKYGLYEYTKMPFGLCSASSTFQRCMELIFRGLQWKTLLIYLDDIIIFSTSVEEHFDRLGEVLKRLQEAGLKLKPKKCEFFKSELVFLGHLVGVDGVKPNPELVQKVKSWQAPTNLKEVQQFLGLCNYYRQFVKDFSTLAAPISRLTRKDVNFIWSDDSEQAFQLLKKKLCEAPILAYPRPVGTYILDTDASNVGIGGVLSQVQDGREKPISYASKKLDKHQQRYSVTRRELLAVITFMHHFKHYLLGREFILRTDHGSLQWIYHFKDPEGQLARWLEVLSQYNFKILHRAGKKHSNADTMSRNGFDRSVCTHYEAGKSPEKLGCGGCESCHMLYEDWQKFNSNVDTVIPLSTTSANKRLEVLDSQEMEKCRRATTRNMKKGQSLSNASPVNTTAVDDRSNWFQGYSNKELENLQREDPDLVIIHSWLDENKFPSREEVACFSPAIRKCWLNKENINRNCGVLYQTWISSVKGVSDKKQLLVPRVLRREVMKYCHDNILSAHLGITKTVQKIKQNYYWYKMSEDVKLHITQCSVCTKNNCPSKKFVSALKDYRVGYPMDRIAIDVMGPLPITERDNEYILVIGDYFTRWMEAFPIPNQQAATVAEKLVHEFVAKFGVPLEIHSDQGRNFESNLFKEVCNLLRIKKTRTTPYRPNSNGLVERFNRTLAKMIRSFIEDNTSEWDVHIPLLTAAYRSTIHPATGFTPNLLMFGRELNSPCNVLHPRPSEESSPEVHDYVSNLRDKMEECYDLARRNLKATAVQQKKDYDARISENKYSCGDLVNKRNPRRKKFETPWIGPYVITKKLSSALFQIKNKNKSFLVHHDLLKPHLASSIPKWARKLQKQIHKT